MQRQKLVFQLVHPQRITVIGSGIVGASAAYYLSKAGALVTVIDKQGPATHSSLGTFAWLNASWAKQPRSYHHFNQLGLIEWKKIQTELSIPVRWNGSIEWFSDLQRNERLVEQIKQQRVWGEASEYRIC